MEGSIAVSKNDQFRSRIIDDYRGGNISRREAATLLSISEKSAQGLAKRDREDGLKGPLHGKSQKNPHNKSLTSSAVSALTLLKN